MRLIKKLGLFAVTGAMALGIGLSLGLGSLETQAAGDYLYTFDSSGSYNGGISDGEIPSARVTIANTGGATITASFYKNSSTTITIFNNGAGETRLYGGAGDGGQLTFVR